MTNTPMTGLPAGKRAAGSPPDLVALRDFAVRHLARFAATEIGLLRVMERRIQRWGHAAEAEGQDSTFVAQACAQARLAAQSVAARMVELGAIDDTAFATSRARRLVRSGRSRQAVAAHLVARGVGQKDVSAALDQGSAQHELAAALIHARRRRLGPFRSAMAAERLRDEGRSDPDNAEFQAFRREMAAMARAGFMGDIARQVLRMPTEQALEIIEDFRRGQE